MLESALVTGAGGFLGARLLDHLRKYPVSRRLSAAGRRGGRGVRVCDFTDAGAVRRLLGAVRPGVVFHCVGSVEAGPWEALFKAHVLATSHLLEAVLSRPGKKARVVLVGSAAEYGEVPASRQPIKETEPLRPASFYGSSKSCQTGLVPFFAARGVPVAAARLFNLLGEGIPPSFAVGNFLRGVAAARPGGLLRTGPLSAVRDFVSVPDACRALVAVALRGRPGEVYNVCSGRGARLREVLRLLLHGSGRSLRVRETARGSARTSVSFCVGDPSKIRHHTGWRPSDRWEDVARSLGEGLRG